MNPVWTPAVEKMRQAGIGDLAIRVFQQNIEKVASGQSAYIRESDILPLTDIPQYEGGTTSPGAHSADSTPAITRTAVIKLNGGLGTSMGLHKAKSLLHVTPERTFLDLIVAQVLAVREAHDASLPLLFMNSFHTESDTTEYLERFDSLRLDDLPLSFLQNRVPKLLRSDLSPVEHPNPDLEWCPPGHGDLYTALPESGLLSALLDRGFRYAIVSNSDNLGAFPDPDLAQWFADSGAPFAMEVCRREANDRKGGHLALRAADGQLILRELAQTSPEDLDRFQDIDRHSYFNTNTLWLDLEALAVELDRRGGYLGLPVIRNAKTVDPTDRTSAEVYQLETGMGTAIEIFDGAVAIEVERSRFLPVKTTNDLLLIRSDVYEVADTGIITRNVSEAPTIHLDPEHFAHIDQFETRAQHVPSLIEARSLTVTGEYTFPEGLVIRGDATLP